MEYLHYRRNPFVIAIKVSAFIVFGGVIDMLFYDLGYDNLGIENRFGVIFFYYVSLFFFIMFQHAIVIVCERPMVCKEIQDQMYSTSVYLFSKFVFDMPINAVGNFLFVVIIYWATGLNQETSEKPLNFFIGGILFQITGVLSGILSGCISLSVLVTVFIAPTVSLCLSLFAGFMTNPDSLPVFTYWIKYLTPSFFIRNGLLYNEFNDLDYDDDVNPEPKDRFGYDWEIWNNFSIVFIHFAIIWAFNIYIFKLR